MTNSIARLAAIALSLTAMDAAAQTGSVIMRRPIPSVLTRSDIPTQTGPGTPGSNPGDVPPADLVTSSPEKTVCDENPGAQGVKLSSVKWVENGWSDGGMSPESCSFQKMTYVCEATYTCDVGGRSQSFVSAAPDSVCEGSRDTVQYPGDTPDPTKFPSDRPLADQASWLTIKFNKVAVDYQTGGTPFADPRVIGVVPWVRHADVVNWWVPAEYGGTGYHRYIRIFLDPGGTGPYDASTDICRQMHANGHPCTNYYSHEGGSVYVAWIIG